MSFVSTRIFMRMTSPKHAKTLLKKKHISEVIMLRNFPEASWSKRVLCERLKIETSSQIQDVARETRNRKQARLFTQQPLVVGIQRFLQGERGVLSLSSHPVVIRCACVENERTSYRNFFVN